MPRKQDGVGTGLGRLYVHGESEGNQEIDVPMNDLSLPESAQAGGHGTAEYALLKNFIGALESGGRVRIDENRGFDITVPGIIAHESALRGGEWMDVPGTD